MSRILTPTDPELNQRLAEAVAAYNTLSPVEKALHDSAQRRSFVRGQMGSEPPRDVLADEVVRLRALLAEAEKLLAEARDSRAPDYIGRSMGWLEDVDALAAKLREAREG